MGLNYIDLSDNLKRRIEEDRKNGYVNPYRFDDADIVRRIETKKDEPSIWRPAFVRDTEKILHLPYYNRYTDKTQVFSFYSNDDITRRGLHVQLVSRIARNIGSVLGLNLDLIEAIALGHDIGHTPFGHAGEKYLSEIYCEHTGRYFNHNVHSVRVLDRIFSRNLSLQTLDGILCHNGEMEMQKYKPHKDKTFEIFDSETKNCYLNKDGIKWLTPMTLEGCVVRICDMIAYLGKDRQDALTARIIPDTKEFSVSAMGSENAEIINNLTVNIIENSYGKDYIALSPEMFTGLKMAKDENYRKIYLSKAVDAQYEVSVKPMIKELYEKLLDDLEKGNEKSFIFTHHIEDIQNRTAYYKGTDYLKEEKNQIVVDYIASMTDNYFLKLYEKLFPNSKYKIEFHSYFE